MGHLAAVCRFLLRCCQHWDLKTCASWRYFCLNQALNELNQKVKAQLDLSNVWYGGHWVQERDAWPSRPNMHCGCCVMSQHGSEAGNLIMMSLEEIKSWTDWSGCRGSERERGESGWWPSVPPTQCSSFLCQRRHPVVCFSDHSHLLCFHYPSHQCLFHSLSNLSSLLTCVSLCLRQNQSVLVSLLIDQSCSIFSSSKNYSDLPQRRLWVEFSSCNRMVVGSILASSCHLRLLPSTRHLTLDLNMPTALHIGV